MIPREQIEEVVGASDIVEIISEYIDLKRQGSNYIGRCPFHNERTPSFSVSREKNIFHCFGCHEHGNVIGFLMKYENIGYVEAIEKLAERAGIKIEKNNRNYNNDREQLYNVYKIAGEHYHQNLISGKYAKPKNYALERGLNEEIITKFNIGYSADGSKLYNHLKELGYKDDFLMKTGLFSVYDNKLVDKFYNRLIFPIFDINSKIVAFGGRSLGERGPKYLNSPETEIFKKSKVIYGLNFARKRKHNFLILCEGYMDVIAMHTYGFDMAIATLGTACNDNHIFEIKKYNDKLFLLYDSDEAGQNAIEKASAVMAKNNISAKVVDISPYKDPDECLKAAGQKFMVERMTKAKYSYDFCIERIRKGYDFSDPTSKGKFTEKIAEILANYPDDIILNSYKDMAVYYGVNEDILLKYIKSAGNKREIEYKKELENTVKKSESTNSGSKIEKDILSWICYPNVYFNIRKYIREEYFSYDFYKDVLLEFDEWYKNHKDISETDISIKFPDIAQQEQVWSIFENSRKLIDLPKSYWKTGINQNIKRFIQDYYDRKYETCDDPVENRRKLTHELEQINIDID